MKSVKVPPLENLEKLYHPRIFGEQVVERIPYSAQEVYLLCPHSKKIGTMGRVVGKSSVLIGDGSCRESSILPWLKAAMNGSSKPIEFREILISSVKEQAFELQTAIRNSFDRNAWLRSEISVDTTKTNIVLRSSGARIMIRPATAAARGQHAQTRMVNKKVQKGLIKIKVDEAWFLRDDDFFRAVISPMLLAGGRGSGWEALSTPYGMVGEMAELYTDPRTGKCAQPFVLGEDGRRNYSFDRELCKKCISTYRHVIFNFPSYENPYADEVELYETKKQLEASGRLEIWDQEYRGIPTSSAGLFFNDHHQKMMWDDELPQFRINRIGEFAKLGVRGKWQGIYDDEGGGAEEEPVRFNELRGGEFYLGIDNNQGVASKRADYASISLVEKLKNKRCPLRLWERFKTAPPFFNGQEYEKHEVTIFLLDYIVFLIEMFRPKRVYIDQGFGQAIYIPLEQRYKGQNLLEYIKTSEQEKMRCLLHLRTMVEMGFAQAPRISELVRETKFLLIKQDALEADKLKVEKAASWGTAGAEVDGIFSWAYAMRGTEDVPQSVGVSVGNQLVLPSSMSGRPLPFKARNLSSIITR